MPANPSGDEPEADEPYVECPECGEEQADMGKGVTCEACGFGPMPTLPEAD